MVQHLLRIKCGPGTGVGIGEVAMNSAISLCPTAGDVLVEEIIQKRQMMGKKVPGRQVP